jgi:hypothetical protein
VNPVVDIGLWTTVLLVAGTAGVTGLLVWSRRVMQQLDDDLQQFAGFSDIGFEI